MTSGPADIPQRSVLRSVLAEGQRLAAVGPGDLDAEVEHASRFARGFPAADEVRGLDLGTGGGLPGLVLALLRPSSAWVLLDAARRRVDAVAAGIDALGLGDRVVAVHGRAEEEVARLGTFDVVTARSFGPPAVVAECARPFLTAGGRLIVSDPPQVDHEQRWPAEGVALFGLSVVDVLDDPSMTVFEAVAEPRVPLPRRPGVAARRPRW